MEPGPAVSGPHGGPFYRSYIVGSVSTFYLKALLFLIFLSAAQVVSAAGIQDGLPFELEERAGKVGNFSVLADHRYSINPLVVLQN